MKKILSIMLALILVLSMATVAFADESTGDATTDTPAAWDGTYTPTTEKTVDNQIKKTYDSENGVAVNETLTFTSTVDSRNPDTTKNLTVSNLVVNSTNPGYLTFTIPSLSVAGVYRWTITENEGNTAGVTYTNSVIHVIVLVEYDNSNHSLKIANTDYYIEKIDKVKTDTFENTFKSGSVTVAKDVTGNMANETDKFEITVTLTSSKPIGTTVKLAGQDVAYTEWTANANKTSWSVSKTLTISKKDGASTFADIPEGVTVTVVENTAEDKMGGYTYVSTNDNKDNTFSKGIVDTDVNTPIVVTNNKTTEVDMGVTLDSLPYILMLVVVCGAMFVLFTKKRAAREN